MIGIELLVLEVRNKFVNELPERTKAVTNTNTKGFLFQPTSHAMILGGLALENNERMGVFIGAQDQLCAVVGHRIDAFDEMPMANVVFPTPALRPLPVISDWVLEHCVLVQEQKRT